MRVCDVVLTEDQVDVADKVLDGDWGYERAGDLMDLACEEARRAEKAHSDATAALDAVGSVENEQRWLETWDCSARADYKSALAEISWWRRILKARANYARKLVEGGAK